MVQRVAVHKLHWGVVVLPMCIGATKPVCVCVCDGVAVVCGPSGGKTERGRGRVCVLGGRSGADEEVGARKQVMAKGG